MNESMISAIKRKDIKELAAQVLETEGKTEAAQELRGASRLTVALIDRTCVNSLPNVVVEDEVTELNEQCDVGTTGACEVSEDVIINVGEIKSLIEAGDKKSLKKAKKALEAQFDENHPNYSGLAKAIKKAKKALK